MYIHAYMYICVHFVYMGLKKHSSIKLDKLTNTLPDSVSNVTCPTNTLSTCALCKPVSVDGSFLKNWFETTGKQAITHCSTWSTWAPFCKPFNPKFKLSFSDCKIGRVWWGWRKTFISTWRQKQGLCLGHLRIGSKINCRKVPDGLKLSPLCSQLKHRILKRVKAIPLLLKTHYSCPQVPTAPAQTCLPWFLYLSYSLPPSSIHRVILVALPILQDLTQASLWWWCRKPCQPIMLYLRRALEQPWSFL